jgi:hypothetical protein
VHPGREMLTLYFSCSGGPSAVFIESVSGNVMPNLCFCILTDLRVTKCFPVRPGPEMSMHYFSCSDGPSAVSVKSASDTIRQTCDFASGRICGTRSAFRCVQVTKDRCTIFHARVAPVRFP